MRYQLRLPGLAIAVVLLVTACGSSTSPTTAPASAAAAVAPAASAAGAVRQRRAAASRPAPAPGHRRRHQAHAVDAGGHRSARAAARRRVQREPQEPGRADGHPDRRLPGQGGRRGRLQRPAGPVLGRRRVHAELDVAGPVPGHHRQDRRLPYADKIAQAHIKASTWDNKQYGLPFIVDLSVWLYNKALYRQAGLDPEKPPTTLEEFADPGTCRRQARQRHPRHVLRRQLRRLRGVHLVADRLGRRRAGHEPRRHQVDAQQRREQADLLDVQAPRR